MSLSLIPGLGPRTREKLEASGVRDLADLVAAGPEAVVACTGMSRERARIVVRLAEARIARGMDSPGESVTGDGNRPAADPPDPAPKRPKEKPRKGEKKREKDQRKKDKRARKDKDKRSRRPKDGKPSAKKKKKDKKRK